MSAPRWTVALLRRLSPPGYAEDVVGDLEEAHRRRVETRGVVVAGVVTAIESVDMAWALLRDRRSGGSGRSAIGLEAQPSGTAGERGGHSRGIGFSWLDFKLGFRMLVRYPGLTLIGGLAMAFAIWIGAGAFEIVTQMVSPRLPLPDGDRIVGVQNWDAARNRVNYQTLHELETWREELGTIEDLGAFRTLERNLITGDGRAEPIEVAEISASAFRVTRVPPLLGRDLLAADERPGAADVAVIGYDVWQRRFAGDPDIVGRTIRLGSSTTTIVGVMPEGYAFPVAQSVWLPLRLNALDYARGEGPSIRMFGRLAGGASLSEAEAELATVGRRAAAQYPDTHEHLRPRVLPFAKSILRLSPLEAAALMSTNLLLILLLVLICGNVALLMFARAATRESEIVVRNALGASRGRIVTQLFSEALVLGTVAAVIGLAAAGYGLRWAMHVGQTELLEGARLPFWVHASLSPRTVLYAVMLTLLAAVIAGVLPARKVTRGLSSRLREAATGSSMQFGGVWTAVIIAQVAVTVALPFAAWAVRRDAVQIRSVDVGFPAEQFLSVRLEMDREQALGGAPDESQAEFAARFASTFRELESRIEAEPGVTAVTSADLLPRMYHPHRLIEIDAGGGAPMPPQWPGYRVSTANVALDFFDVLSIPLIAGRQFHPGDIGLEEDGIGVVIVNEAYVKRVLGDRNPIGRRLRYAFQETVGPSSAEGPWYEIVGVAGNVGMSSEDFDPKVARIYHPAGPGDAYPLHMAVQLMGAPESFGPRLIALAAAADPTMRVYDTMRMDRLVDSELEFLSFWFRLILAVSMIALLLSLSGIYAVMSFTVARRTREIGIRTALGGSARSIVLAIFSRSLVQVGLGIIAGAALAGALAFGMAGGVTVRGAAMIAGYAALMMAVCMLACIIPTRRALGIQPTEAMKTE